MQFRACLRRIFGFSLSGQAIVNFGRASAGYECRKCFDIRTEKVVVFFSVQLERRSAGAIFLKYLVISGCTSRTIEESFSTF